MKSLCIKTNNTYILNYTLDTLKSFPFKDLYFTKKEFKSYTNIVIHYKGLQISDFIYYVSKTLAFVVIQFYEKKILKNIINSNYFYFNTFEKKEILQITNNLILESEKEYSFENRESLLINSFFIYLNENKSVFLDGFINFRLKNYFNTLNFIIDIAVNKFIVEKEYSEFISLLKLFINTQNSNCSLIHLIYKNNQSILLDENKNVLDLNSSITNTKFLCDISFSSNDFALNTLLDLLPEKLVVHIIDNEDEFINTLQLIFENKIQICYDCKICNIYKYKKSITQT